MKVCPTCERKYPDLISLCPSDQTELVDGSEIGKPGTPAKSAASAPAKSVAASPAKQIDSRELEAKLFAPLPSRSAAAAAAPAKAAASAPVSPTALAPPSVKMAATPAAAPKPAPNSTSKMSETVFDDTPQKSSKMPALASAEIPWNKIGPAIGAVLLVVVLGYFFLHKSSAPAPSDELTTSPNSADVDLDLSLRQTLGKIPALRNQNIDLRVSNGTVILTGEASSQARIEQAIKAAKAMPGVRDVVNHITVNPEVGTRSEAHASATSAGLGNADISSESGLATQAKAHELTLAGDRAMSHGDYKAAASFYKQAVSLNPNDTAASLGYTQAMDKLQH